MKRLLISAGTLVFVGALAVSATGAFFSDTETSTGNTFAAGDLDLTVDSQAHYAGLVCNENGVWEVEDDNVGTTREDLVGEDCGGTWTQTDLGPSNQFFNYSDVKPGDPGENTISFHTTNDAWMCANVNVTSNVNGGEGDLVVADTFESDFENPPYTLGNIDTQEGWSKTGSYDVEVNDSLSTTGFGDQSLRISDSETSGSFGDWAFAPQLSSDAGESGVGSENHYEAQFDIASAVPDSQQTDLQVSVAPTDINGSRMSYLGFSDEADGMHVTFYDVTDAGPLGTAATFNEHDIATLDRSVPHTVKLTIDFVDGPANDVVKVWVDGVLKITGTSWEDYYRYDPEQNGNGNVLPAIDTLIFQARGTAHAGHAGDGFLFDNLSLSTGSISDAGALADGIQFYAWRDDGDNIHQENEEGLFGPLPFGFGATTTLTLADSETGSPFVASTTNYIGLAWCAGDLTVENDGSLSCDGAAMGNEAQGDSMTADISLYAEQSRNNGDFLCEPNIQ